MRLGTAGRDDNLTAKTMLNVALENGILPVPASATEFLFKGGCSCVLHFLSAQLDNLIFRNAKHLEQQLMSM